MRTPLIAGNWKMNMTEAKAITLARKLIWHAVRSDRTGVEVLVFPPFTALSQLHKLLVGTEIHLGAQNMHWEESGAFTGEISPKMVAEFCRYIILGHSERRSYFGESNEAINKKVGAAIKQSLVPIVCVGESLKEKDAGLANEVVYTQMIEGLKGAGIHHGDQLVIAYEPVWAIGTGRSATAAEVNDLIAATIRPALTRLFGDEFKAGVRVLYGGSVNAGNARSFLRQAEIDGALVGGASLDADSFMGIVEAAV